MRVDDGRAALDELATEFDQLRSALLRAAKALIAAEDRRTAVLHRLARHADLFTARDLQADAHHARANADTATGIVVQLERMAMHAVPVTGRPSMVETQRIGELTILQR